jgi:undecaprenyl-diphosphatase
MSAEWLDILREWDRSVLLSINGCNTPLLDGFFKAVTDRWFWFPFYGLLAWHLFKAHGVRFFRLLVVALLTVVVTDQIASSFLKPFVHRLRPCHVAELSSRLHLVDGMCGGMFGFVSSHAANTFGFFALVFFLSGRKWHWLTATLFVWASTVSFSRIYLGVHYPADILGGAMLGLLAGGAFAFLSRTSGWLTLESHESNE